METSEFTNCSVGTGFAVAQPTSPSNSPVPTIAFRIARRSPSGRERSPEPRSHAAVVVFRDVHQKTGEQAQGSACPLALQARGGALVGEVSARSQGTV